MSMTNAEIVKLAPAAAAERPAPHCSDKFSLVPTLKMVDLLRSEGYVAVNAQQSAVRPDRWGSQNHAMHRVVMRLQGTESLSKEARLGGVVPELLIVNASDGSTRFQMKQGILRMICSNGLVVFSTTDASQFTHKNIDAHAVINEARRLAANTKPLFDKIARWSKIKLNDAAQQRFAAEAMALRVPNESRRAAYDLNTLLAARRDEDREPTLWNVFNRVQENAMRGHVSTKASEGQRMSSLRPLNAIGADLDFNTGLWAMAERWAAVVK